MCCERAAVPTRFSRPGIRLIAAAFGLPWREVLADLRAAVTWPRPADDLVVWLAERHGWKAEQSVLYLTALRRLGSLGEA